MEEYMKLWSVEELAKRVLERSSLDPEKQLEVNEKKIATQIENEKYLRSHPEIRGLVSLMISRVLERKPEDPEEVVSVLADLFSEDDLSILRELLRHLVALGVPEYDPAVRQLRGSILEAERAASEAREDALVLNIVEE